MPSVFCFISLNGVSSLLHHQTPTRPPTQDQQQNHQLVSTLSEGLETVSGSIEQLRGAMEKLNQDYEKYEGQLEEFDMIVNTARRVGERGETSLFNILEIMSDSYEEHLLPSSSSSENNAEGETNQEQAEAHAVARKLIHEHKKKKKKRTAEGRRMNEDEYDSSSNDWESDAHNQYKRHKAHYRQARNKHQEQFGNKHTHAFDMLEAMSTGNVGDLLNDMHAKASTSSRFGGHGRRTQQNPVEWEQAKCQQLYECASAMTPYDYVVRIIMLLYHAFCFLYLPCRILSF